MAKRHDGECDWILARDALALVGPLYSHPNYASEAILAEAAADRLAATAENSEEERTPGDVEGLGESDVQQPFWRAYKDAGGRREREDWNAGAFAYWIGLEDYETRRVRAFGVRFCAHDLRRVFNLDQPPQAPRVQPPYRAKPKNDVERPKRATKDELRQWFPTYEAVSDDFRFDSVEAAAAAHFHPRPVTRQPLRDIIGEFERTRNRGRTAR
jgi:hypothetical protein